MNYFFPFPTLISNISNSTFLLKCSKLKSITNFFFILIFAFLASLISYQIFYIFLDICLFISLQGYDIRITWLDFIRYTSPLTSITFYSSLYAALHSTIRAIILKHLSYYTSVWNFSVTSTCLQDNPKFLDIQFNTCFELNLLAFFSSYLVTHSMYFIL